MDCEHFFNVKFTSGISVTPRAVWVVGVIQESNEGFEPFGETTCTGT